MVRGVRKGSRVVVFLEKVAAKLWKLTELAEVTGSVSDVPFKEVAYRYQSAISPANLKIGS